MKRSLLVLALFAVLAALAPSRAHATPAFARQTGVSCQGCHTVFPELTPFGRKFKLNGYVFTNVKQLEPLSEQGQRTLALSEIPPLSVQLQASNTTLQRSVPDAGATGDLAQRNSTEFPQALSLFYTGKISDNLGAFLQLTWSPPSDSVGIDNSDLRFANHAAFDSIGMPDFIYGLTLNNNPTSQDVWNSTPAWGYPYILPDSAVPPVASTLLDGQLAQESAGLSAYVYLFDHLYLEGGAYRSAQTSFTNATTGGPGPLDSTAPNDRISGVAPYWRLAWEQAWGEHSLEFGTYGIRAETHPTGIGENGPLNVFTDIALDGQYQFITDDHIFSLAGTWIHEHRHFNNVLLATHQNNDLDTERLTASYYFRRRIGGYVQGFSTTGSRDPIMYAMGTPVLGSAKGRPDTQGAIVELDFLPWLNTKLGVQYTIYSKFNGDSKNYDGFGRKASDNNALFVYVWTAF
ncbi:MAG TPA: cytochrome C [Methylomirabilota bacterium]|nr:cytochrome C [Methylomirabilota bacterium]